MEKVDRKVVVEPKVGQYVSRVDYVAVMPVAQSMGLLFALRKSARQCGCEYSGDEGKRATRLTLPLNIRLARSSLDSSRPLRIKACKSSRSERDL